MRAAPACLLLLLAGCLSPAPPPQDAPERAVQPDPFAGCNVPDAAGAVDQCVEVVGAPGIHLRGTHFTWGQFHLAQVNATNLGDTTYWVKSEDCGGKPWRDTMDRDGAPVQKDPPTAACAICSWRAFGPGESLRDTFQWDELVWDQESNHRDAAAGRYTWTVRLGLRTSPGCDTETANGDLVFPLDL
jgi:hypothetical protein